MSGLSDENIREMIQALDLIKGGFRWRSHFSWWATLAEQHLT